MTRCIRALAGFAVATALAMASTGRAATPCVLQQVGELPIQFDHGRLLVEAQINGRPARMIVDTGASNTLLFRPSAKELGLAVKPAPGVAVYGVGGDAGSGEVRVAELQVAGLIARNQDLLVSGKQPLGAEQGLLGADFLLQADLDIDVAGGKLRFFRPKGCAGDQVVYWGKAYSATRMLPSGDVKAIRVTVKVNDVPVSAEMDTGANSSVLSAAAAAKAGLTPTTEGVADAGQSHGLGAQSVQTYAGVFRSFSFGDETIRNARLGIADLFGADKEVRTGSRIAASVLDAPDMLLGADFFRSHRVYVAISQRMVYVSYVGGPVFSTRATPVAPPAPAP